VSLKKKYFFFKLELRSTYIYAKVFSQYTLCIQRVHFGYPESTLWVSIEYTLGIQRVHFWYPESALWVFGEYNRYNPNYIGRSDLGVYRCVLTRLITQQTHFYQLRYLDYSPVFDTHLIYLTEESLSFSAPRANSL
jgi:hypothetical protein